jgi:TolB-like protein/DNA-binding winged helix-turn-helix (wHTH) protein
MQREPGSELAIRESIAWPGFVLDLNRGELLDARGQPADLRAQALQVLLVLGEHLGQVVGKDELMRRVWSDVVVTEDSLVQAVGDIRRVLGDAGHQRVRTVPRRGYMLVHDVPGDAGAASDAAASPPRPKRVLPMLAGAAALVLLVGLGVSWWRAPAPSLAVSLRSLAILPFESAGPDAVDDWFVDAMTADLTSKASRWSRVMVIGGGTMRTYKGKNADPRSVARELGVQYVMSGRVQRNGDQVHFDLALIDGESGHIAWSDQRDVDRADLRQSLGDIAGGIAKVLLIEWGGAIGGRTARLKPNEVEGEDLALQGFNVFLRSMGPENFERARKLFEQSVERDPASLHGLAGVSLANSMNANFGWTPDRDGSIRRSEAAFARLEAIDANHHLTLLSSASLRNLHGDWEGLLEVSAALIQGYPNDPTSYHHRCSALLRLAKFEQSIPACERAIRISPRESRTPIWNGLIGMNEFMLDRYGAAVDRARTMVTGNPNFPFYSLLLAAALAHDGRRAEAEHVIAELRARLPDVDSARIAVWWPAGTASPAFVAGRDRIAATVRELGLP